MITNSETHEKDYFHPKVLPSAVISDPELTVGMPSFITAGTDLDALLIVLRLLVPLYYHPMSQGIAVEGMKLVIQNLPIFIMILATLKQDHI